MIVNGAFVDRTHLKEGELAAQIGVSRTPVRDALRRLHSEGLVEFVPNQGVFVTPWESQDFDEIIAVRALLEGYGAELAARKISEAQLSELRELAAQMEAVVARRDEKLYEDVTTLNARFHGVIAKAAGNRRLESLLSGLFEFPLVLRTYHESSGAELDRSMSHHRDIIDALTERDSSWAGSAMRSHIIAGRGVLARATKKTPSAAE